MLAHFEVHTLAFFGDELLGICVVFNRFCCGKTRYPLHAVPDEPPRLVVFFFFFFRLRISRLEGRERAGGGIRAHQANRLW